MAEYAETWLSIGRLPLRRRDVNAMRLALDVARGECGFPSDALAALRAGRTGLVRDLADDVDNADYPEDCWGPGKRVERRRFARLVRARLALLLRTLLRVDAGDYGEVACDRCGYQGDGSHERGDVCGLCWQQCRRTAGEYAPRHFRPLWQDAPGGQR